MSQTYNKLTSNLPQLQNLIKRDPESYYEEFKRQHAVYLARKSIFEQNPTLNNQPLHQLVMFFAQISHCYTDALKEFPSDLVSLLEQHGQVLHQEMRMAFVRALILLRNKNLLSATALLSLFFRLLCSQDKNLRKFLRDHIINDIKNINSKGKDMKLNKELQNYMFEMLRDNHAVAIKTSLQVLIELYKKRVWNDPKTVNIIGTACFCKVTKVMVAAVKFFIGIDEDNPEEDESSDSDEELPTLKQVKLATRVNKTKRKINRKEEKVKKAMVNQKNKKNKKVQFDFSAIHLVHDPQNMADRLYKSLASGKKIEKFEVKLMLMNLISRLIGIRELYLPNFYAYLQKYLTVHQRDVTKIMTYAAQAAHSLVPPDDLEPLLRTLADNFVTERYSGEVMAMGINAIRELCARNPYCMNEDLLQDLTAYKSHKDKSVNMAARSLIMLFRDVNPDLLAKKDRGAPTELSKESEVKCFGQNYAKDFISGAEVLTLNIEDPHKKKREESDSESEWEDVSPDEEEAESAEEDGEKGDDKLYSKKEAIEAIMKFTPEERIEKAKNMMTTRVFTDEDFAKIDAAQAAKKVERYSASRKRNRKRKMRDDDDSRKEIVSLSSIEMVYKKRKHDKENRMQTVLEGREGRDKFGSRKGRMNVNASTTNREKIKAKSFMMMKHKIKSGKQRLSFRDRQLKLKKALLKAKLK